jgi:predicted nucleic acid-binding protein
MADLFVDASAWIAWSLGEHHSTKHRGKSLNGSTLLLAELASLVERGRLPPASVAKLVDAVRLEPPSPEDMAAGGRLHGALRVRGNPKVSLIDCITYSTARRLRLDYVTTDRDLEGQPGVHLL